MSCDVVQKGNGQKEKVRVSLEDPGCATPADIYCVVS